jgi:hypothetical protein
VLLGLLVTEAFGVEEQLHLGSPQNPQAIELSREKP